MPDGTFSAWTGQIRTADFGQPNSPAYPNNQNCNWVITMSKGSQIRLQFDANFALEAPDQSGECAYDFVEVSFNQ